MTTCNISDLIDGFEKRLERTKLVAEAHTTNPARPWIAVAVHPDRKEAKDNLTSCMFPDTTGGSLRFFGDPTTAIEVNDKEFELAYAAALQQGVTLAKIRSGEALCLFIEELRYLIAQMKNEGETNAR